MSGYSEAKCKFCGDKILWNNSSRYADGDGEWHNRRLPVNPNGGEHRCGKKAEWVLARQAALMAVHV
jgi:hypothetical protein